MSLSKERKKFIKRLLPKPQKQIWDIEINEGTVDDLINLITFSVLSFSLNL